MKCWNCGAPLPETAAWPIVCRCGASTVRSPKVGDPIVEVEDWINQLHGGAALQHTKYKPYGREEI